MQMAGLLRERPLIYHWFNSLQFLSVFPQVSVSTQMYNAIVFRSSYMTSTELTLSSEETCKKCFQQKR